MGVVSRTVGTGHPKDIWNGVGAQPGPNRAPQSGRHRGQESLLPFSALRFTRAFLTGRRRTAAILDRRAVADDRRHAADAVSNPGAGRLDCLLASQLFAWPSEAAVMSACPRHRRGSGTAGILRRDAEALAEGAIVDAEGLVPLIPHLGHLAQHRHEDAHH